MQTDINTATAKNNRLAVASLVMSIVAMLPLCISSFTWPFLAGLSAVLGIAAVLTGFQARKQIEKSGGTGEDLATAGMILGGGQVVLIILGIAFTVGMLALGAQLGGTFSSINDSLK